jgi:hypothetical protein
MTNEGVVGCKRETAKEKRGAMLVKLEAYLRYLLLLHAISYGRCWQVKALGQCKVPMSWMFLPACGTIAQDEEHQFGRREASRRPD